MSSLNPLGYDLERMAYPHDPNQSTTSIFENNSGVTQLIRPIALSIDHIAGTTLEQRLFEADRHLNLVASAVGGSVVAHKWILTDETYQKYKVPGLFTDIGQIDNRYRGFWVSAEVTQISGRTLKTVLTELDDVRKREYTLRFLSRIHAIQRYAHRRHGWYALDLAATRQFMVKEVGPLVIPDTNLTLTDIDLTTTNRRL